MSGAAPHLDYALPVALDAVIERRLLVNFRLDPQVAARLLPAPFRPQLVEGDAVAGVCLIRLGGMRPAGFPVAAPVHVESAAHRIAVEWDAADGPAHGVWVPERHTASRLAAAVGGRGFPGVQRPAAFRVRESAGRSAVSVEASDVSVAADVETTERFSSGLFADLASASAFFRAGDVGWSPARRADRAEGLRLTTDRWRIEPGLAHEARSSFFDALPAGSAVFDSALVMRDVPVRWEPVARLAIGPVPHPPLRAA